MVKCKVKGCKNSVFDLNESKLYGYYGYCQIHGLDLIRLKRQEIDRVQIEDVKKCSEDITEIKDNFNKKVSLKSLKRCCVSVVIMLWLCGVETFIKRGFVGVA